MDDGKLRIQMARGERAKRLLEDELIKEAFAKIEAEIIEAWKGSAADDERGRFNAYLMHRLLQNFRGQFARLVITGDGAAKDLLRIEQESKLRRLVNGRR